MRDGESPIHTIFERTPGESEELSRPERIFCVKEIKRWIIPEVRWHHGQYRPLY